MIWGANPYFRKHPHRHQQILEIGGTLEPFWDIRCFFFGISRVVKQGSSKPLTWTTKTNHLTHWRLLSIFNKRHAKLQCRFIKIVVMDMIETIKYWTKKDDALVTGAFVGARVSLVFSSPWHRWNCASSVCFLTITQVDLLPASQTNVGNVDHLSCTNKAGLRASPSFFRGAFWLMLVFQGVGASVGEGCSLMAYGPRSCMQGSAWFQHGELW